MTLNIYRDILYPILVKYDNFIIAGANLMYGAVMRHRVSAPNILLTHANIFLKNRYQPFIGQTRPGEGNV